MADDINIMMFGKNEKFYYNMCMLILIVKRLCMDTNRLRVRVKLAEEPSSHRVCHFSSGVL